MRPLATGKRGLTKLVFFLGVSYVTFMMMLLQYSKIVVLDGATVNNFEFYRIHTS